METLILAEEVAGEVRTGGRWCLRMLSADTAAGREVREMGRFGLEAEWLELGQRFAPFPLVKAFVTALLSAPPARVVVDALSGATLDLARLAAALGFEVAVRLPAAGRFRETDEVAMRWLDGLLRSVSCLIPPAVAEDEKLLRERLPALPPCSIEGGGGGMQRATAGFGYEAYAFGGRDHELLYAMQAGFVDHFRACSRVLDVGCGTGIFLEALARRGVAAEGVERNRVSARFARSLGHVVHDEDALAFLASTGAQWDGVYCSHFIEHLPIEAADVLVASVAAALKPGGVAVFVFPDPESIRSQLLGFWRDPEHVRFYHPELVATMAEVHGLQLEFDSQRVDGRRVVPFAMEPPQAIERSATDRSWWARVLSRLGIASAAELHREREHGDALASAVRRLWEVNQTWAWDDNAVLRFRKRAALI